MTARWPLIVVAYGRFAVTLLFVPVMAVLLLTLGVLGFTYRANRWLIHRIFKLTGITVPVWDPPLASGRVKTGWTRAGRRGSE